MVYSPFAETMEPPAATPNAGDAELVRQIVASPPGEAREAEAELYRRLAPRVRLYGLRHLRDEQAAADLTQQVLLIALEALRSGRLREPEKLASFVLGSCRLAVRDLRRNAQRRERLLEQYGRDLAASTPAPSPAFEEARLAGCLEKLAERERSVVVLTFYDEQSSGEVANFLGLSAANVRVIRHRALARLRECLSGPGGHHA